MAAHKITGFNLVLIALSHNLFWMDGPFSRQSLREYPGSDIVDASFTILNFVDIAFCLITALCGRKNSFGFSLWLSETFSFTLFTNWSLITWSYALNVSRFCLSRFKSNFWRPRLPNLLLFKGPHKTSLIPAPLISLKLLFEFFYTHSHHDLSESLSFLVTSISHRRSKLLTDVLVYTELTKSLSLPGDIMTQLILVCSAIGSWILPTLGHFYFQIITRS